MSAFPPSALETLAYHDYGQTLAPMSFRRARFAGGAMEPRDAAVKRAADIVLASVSMLLMIVPMLLAIIAIRLTSKGPALFRQERIGLNGRRFVMLKFRTMHHTADPAGSLPLWRPRACRVSESTSERDS